MIGRAWNGVCNVEKKQAPRQQRGDADMDLLRRNAIKDGQKQGGRQDTGQDDVHNVELVTASYRHRESDI